MRRLLAAALAFALTGCSSLTAGTPETVTIQNQSSATVALRLGNFKPGQASVSDETVIAEGPLNPKGSASFQLTPGRYTLEAVAQTTASETAVTTLDIKAGSPRTVTLVEQFKLVPRKDDPKQFDNQRILGWDD